MSEIRVNTVKDSGGSYSSSPSQIYQGRSQAWVNFNGVGTVGIRRSYNVSSISDNGTGQYTMNFSTSFSTNYCAAGCTGSLNGQTRRDLACTTETFNSTNVRVYTQHPNGLQSDHHYNSVSIFGA